MSTVIHPEIPFALRVKNLSWLLRHWKDVEKFHLLPFDTGKVCDGLLVATMIDGSSYVSSFASFDLARQWLHRPVFRGLPLNDCGTETTC
jgi:hypothetical protein